MSYTLNRARGLSSTAASSLERLRRECSAAFGDGAAFSIDPPGALTRRSLGRRDLFGPPPRQLARILGRQLEAWGTRLEEWSWRWEA